ncbi:hypothetical protein WDW86_07050 [Bdellovibrionota bacterium FG-2]
MKTLTEFAAITLKNASKTQAELTTAGKTPEELPAAMGEALKLEGDKLTFLLAALEIVGTKVTDLKRVVVYSLNEGETAPPTVKQKGEHCYLVEFYPSLTQKAQHDDRGDSRGRDGRGGARGDKRGKRGDSRGPRPGGDRRPPRESAPANPLSIRPSIVARPTGEPSEARPALAPREPRPPRVPKEPVKSNGYVIKLASKAGATEGVTPPAEMPQATETSGSSDTPPTTT